MFIIHKSCDIIPGFNEFINIHKIANLKTPRPLFDGKMAIIPSSTISQAVKNDVKYLFENILTTNIEQDTQGNTTGQTMSNHNTRCLNNINTCVLWDT